jgi:hypothetical protein
MAKDRALRVTKTTKYTNKQKEKYEPKPCSDPPSMPRTGGYKIFTDQNIQYLIETVIFLGHIVKTH